CAACPAAWWCRGGPRSCRSRLDGAGNSRYSLGPRRSGTVAKLVRQGTANPSFPGSNPGGASTFRGENTQLSEGEGRGPGTPRSVRLCPKRVDGEWMDPAASTRVHSAAECLAGARACPARG